MDYPVQEQPGENEKISGPVLYSEDSNTGYTSRQRSTQPVVQEGCQYDVSFC
jgi:hypothetical protein